MVAYERLYQILNANYLSFIAVKKIKHLFQVCKFDLSLVF